MRKRRPGVFCRLLLVIPFTLALAVWAATVGPFAAGAQSLASAAPAPEYAPGALLVRFKDDAPPTEQAALAAAHGLRQVGILPGIGARRFAVPPGQEVALAEALGQSAAVLYAQPDYLRRATVDPNDPYYSANQWGLAKVEGPTAWGLADGNGIVIAVVDSGIDLDHPDLAAKLVPGWDFIDNDGVPDDLFGHGTHVAGIAAAVTDNGLGIAGTAPGAKLMPVRVLDAGGQGTDSGVADGMIWATDHGAKIINLSLGGNEESPVLNDAADYAIARGVVVVAAAGNYGTTTEFYPAAYPPVVAVAATDTYDARASFSNYGPWVDLAAPGVNIYSTYPGGGYAWMSGTSMATPFVSGVAALVRQRFPGLDPAGVVSRLTQGTIAASSSGLGSGRIDAPRALALPEKLWLPLVLSP